MAEGISRLIDELNENGLFDYVGSGPLPPSTEEGRAWYAERSRGLPVTEDLLILLDRAGGAYVGQDWGFNLLMDQTFYECNTVREDLYEDLPSAVFFATDNGGGMFFEDVDGSLGYGNGAVYWVDASATLPKNCIFCSRSVADLLRGIERGEKPWHGPKLPEMGAPHMLEYLRNHRDMWSGGEGAQLSELFLAALKHQRYIPDVLNDLLLMSDGLAFPKRAVRIYSVDELIPVEQAFKNGQRAAAYIFGCDGEGNKLAITLQMQAKDVSPGWPPLEGIVVRLLPDQPLEAAKILGPMTQVVIQWAGGN